MWLTIRKTQFIVLNKFMWSGLRCECTLYWQFCTSYAKGVLERLCVWNSSVSHQCWQSRADSPAGRYSNCIRKSIYAVFMVPYAVNSFSWDFFFLCVHILCHILNGIQVLTSLCCVFITLHFTFIVYCRRFKKIFWVGQKMMIILKVFPFLLSICYWVACSNCSWCWHLTNLKKQQ